jgi:hypothetical protein
MRALLEVDPTQGDSCTRSGNTALHRAAAYGQDEAVTLLIELILNSATPEMIDSLNVVGETPLLRACRWGHASTARKLVAAGANPELVDLSGLNARMWAEKKGFSDVIQAIEPHNGDAQTIVQADEEGHGIPGEEEGEEGEGDEEEEEGGGGIFGQPIKAEGWMAKQGHFIRNWRNRWFMLDGRNIYYFDKEGASKPKGHIYMEDGTDIFIEERYSKPFCFTLRTPKKTFILQAANEEELLDWVEAITNNLECCTPSDGGNDEDFGYGD